jgi:hypothetical protein
MSLEIVPPNENFRGMSYGEWAAEWNKWLFSEDPDTYDGGNLLFLRGNVDYRPVGNQPDSPRYVDSEAIYDKTGKNKETIIEGTAVFIPILTSVLFLSDNYEGKIIKDEQELRYFINKDTDNTGEIWAAIKRKGEKNPIKLVKNLKQYRFESPLFKIKVSPNSLLRNKMEIAVKPGVYDGITAGYYIMIKSLPPSTYRLIFGGTGVGVYRTNSVYDIDIIKKEKERTKDTSNAIINSKYFTSI